MTAEKMQVLFHTTTAERAERICQEGFDKESHFCTGAPKREMHGGSQVLMFAGPAADVEQYRCLTPETHFILPQTATEALERLACVHFDEWEDKKTELMAQRRDLKWTMV